MTCAKCPPGEAGDGSESTTVSFKSTTRPGSSCHIGIESKKHTVTCLAPESEADDTADVSVKCWQKTNMYLEI
jgi:hypothetical protein